jgi:hypothetical protein
MLREIEAIRPLGAFSPAMMIEPVSRASGLSMESLRVTAGNPMIEDSSLMVPESEITHLASI